jgi:assimilatory nitrate reductase catalytic subunit
VLTYHDLHRQQQRALRIERDASGREALQAFWLAGDASGEPWLRTLLEANEPLAVPGRQLLAPTHRMRQTSAPRSPQICTCFNVTEQSIRETLTQCSGSLDARVQHLQQTLRCGTNCGSCLPTLRTLAKAVEPSTIRAA